MNLKSKQAKIIDKSENVNALKHLISIYLTKSAAIYFECFKDSVARELLHNKQILLCHIDTFIMLSISLLHTKKL